MPENSNSGHSACPCGDIEAIRRLCAEYGRLLDRRDAQGWAELFAPEGEWVGGELYGVIAGRADLAAFMAREFANTPPCVHMFGNFSITVDESGTEAANWSRWILLEQGEGGIRAALAGSYTDRLVKLREGWRFKRREVAVDLPAEAATGT